MSTTGPVTRVIRPIPVAGALASGAVAVASVIFLFLYLVIVIVRESVCAANDLGNLLCNFCLTCIVTQASVGGDEFVGVIACGLHRLLCCSMFCCSGLQ